ncbi:unnamed protein product [Ectocarpus sp. 6 AP-2014]
MEMEECWDTDTEVDEVNDDNIGPLLVAQPDLPTTAAAAATAALPSPSERVAAACLPHATGAHEQQQPPQQVPSGGRRTAASSSSAAGPTGGTGGIPPTPNSDANGATLARLVSTWGPVTSQDGWRQAAAAAAASPASMGGVGSGVVGQVRRGFQDGFREASAHRGVPQGGAARGDRVGGTRASTRNRNSGGGGAQDGDRGRDHLEDVNEGGGGNNGLLAVGLPSGLSLGLGGGTEASLTGMSNNSGGGGGGGGGVGEPSSSGSSDSSNEDSSPGAGVETNPPEELLRALVGARITIALLLLLMCHYIVTHLLGIAAFSMGTAIVVVLDQRLWSHSGAQRRVNAVVEMAFVLYRCLLPAPVWLEFYGKDSDYFAGIYLVLKGMQVSFRVDRFVRAACYVRRGELDRGKLATPEEVAEAGSPDCSICYDRMSRPLLLPCNHLFCGECVAEWLERERTCPLCRAEVPSSNPIPRSLRDGRTTVVPQIL